MAASVRISLLDPEKATGPARDIFDSVKAKIGMVPNLYRVMGNSPAALAAYLALNRHLAESGLSTALREKIALAISERNRCGYCLSAHSVIASMSGVEPKEIAEARAGRAADKREAAALALAVQLVDGRGWIGDEALAERRAAGLTEADLVEVVAMVATLTFSNFMNHLARTPIDFPLAPDLPVQGA